MVCPSPCMNSTCRQFVILPVHHSASPLFCQSVYRSHALRGAPSAPRRAPVIVIGHDPLPDVPESFRIPSGRAIQLTGVKDEADP
jgi:hypothetical protein